ncbi:MAG: molybdate ABC transporter substrate-binding protein [Hydrogenothermaceae bacterium]
MLKVIYAVFLTSILLSKAFSGEITIYAASDLTYAFTEIEKIYQQNYPKDKLKVIYGSSGKGYSQILNGAPYDMLFSADMEYVKKLQDQGLTVSNPKPYAVGRIVIWTRKDSGINVNEGINVVLNPAVKKIAIANWEHAPYGVAAKQCLEYYKLFDKVRSKLVLGENISQTAQYVKTANTEIGFLALSIAKSETLQKEGIYYLLPSNCHKEIIQGYVILKNATNSKEKLETAKRFESFIGSPEGRSILKKYGFLLPGEQSE